MTAPVRDSLDTLSSILGDVRESLGGLDDKATAHTVRDLERVARVLQSVMLDAVAQLEMRGIAAAEGFGNTARLLAAMLRLSGAEARTRVEHATMLGPRRAMTGAVLEPTLPVAAAALAAGHIGTGQLRVIAETLAALPASVPGPQRERVEADLVRYGRDFDPRRLRLIAARMVATLDPDGPEPDDGPQPGPPVRGELWLRDRRDGRLGLEGWLDPEHGSMVRSLIEQLASSSRLSTDDPDRSVPVRQADALIELCERARAAPDFPTAGGEPPHLTVTLSWDALRTALGGAELDQGQRISARDARRLACDCKVIPVVLGGDSEPLDVGRAMRTVPRGLRRALVARDGGCSFPGCRQPPQRCAGHHARHWVDGGETSTGNCCLLCELHHHQVHLQGWDVTIRGGRVQFQPPAIVDPDRRPLTNPLRH